MKNCGNTKRKLLDSVKYLIKKDGINALNIPEVAKKAGISPLTAYTYFRDEEQLIESYIHEKDFWNNYAETVSFGATVEERIRKMLAEQFPDFYNHCEMEALLLGEVSTHHSLITQIARKDASTDDSAYFDIISRLLLMGTDQLILAHCVRGSGDAEEDERVQQKELFNSITQVVNWTFG